MSVESAKLNAARMAVEEVLKHEVVGVGTGTTVGKFVELISRDERFRGKLYVPSSLNTALKLARAGLRVLFPPAVPEVEVYVDGADEVDPQLNMVKGGGAALTMEKILAFYSRRRIFIVDHTKLVDRLGTRHPVPIEVSPPALAMVLKKLSERGFKARPRTPAGGKVGPVISDLGGVIVDVETGPLDDPEELEEELRSMPGVIETGIFVGLADEVIVGWPSGCRVLERR